MKIPFVTEAIEGLGNVFNKGVQTFKGSQKDRDKFQHEESQSSKDQFKQEFVSSKDGWFDSLVNNLNRLPRPAFVAHIFFFFWLAYLDPTNFAILCASFTLVPPIIWELVRIVVLFFFGGRILREAFNKKSMSISPEQLAQYLKQIDNIKKIERDQKSKNDVISEITDDDLNELRQETDDMKNEILKKENEK